MEERKACENAFPKRIVSVALSWGVMRVAVASLRFFWVEHRSFFLSFRGGRLGQQAKQAKHVRISQSVSQSSWAYMGCVHSARGGCFFFEFSCSWPCCCFCLVEFFVWLDQSGCFFFSVWLGALAPVFRVEACDN